MNILVVVDMQNDFIDGALGSAQAERIVSGVAEKIRAAAGQGSLIFVTQDTHSGEYLSTLEGKNLPVPHCLRGSEGWRLHEDVRAALEEAAPERLQIIEKPGFGSVELMEQLGRAAAAGPVEEIEFVGLCTDICVIANAMLAKACLTEVPVVVDAACCAGVTPQSHQTALDAMTACQIEIRNRGREPWAGV